MFDSFLHLHYKVVQGHLVDLEQSCNIHLAQVKSTSKLNLYNECSKFVKAVVLWDSKRQYTLLSVQRILLISTTYYNQLVLYSWYLQSDHSKSGNIWYPDFLRVRFQMVRLSNGQALALVSTIQKLHHLKSRLFVLISNDFWQNESHLFRF